MTLLTAMKAVRPQPGMKYEGVVVNNNDPLKARRLKIRTVVHPAGQVPDDHLPWAVCGVYCGTGAKSNDSTFAVPAVGARVLVEFQAGDPNQPLYLGGLVGINDVPSDFQTNYPNRVGFVLSNGTKLVIDKSASTVLFESGGGATLSIDGSGNITITTSGGIDLNSASLTHNGKNIGATHRHGGVSSGGSQTSPPV